MLKIFRASRSNVFVWIILALLIVGLAGFGITTGGGGGRPVAQVGDSRVEADALARALEQELRALSAQVGRQVPMSEARQFGVDRMVLSRLIADAALDEEARRLELSTGDAAVQRLVLATPAFRGAGGSFDRQAYLFALERAGLTPAEFEELLRGEATREMIAAAIQSSAAMPETAALALLAFAGERRRIAWIALDADALPEPPPAPDDAALEAFLAENAARYTRPETRRVAYALLDPEALAATIEVPEEELRAAYEAAGERFDTPERRAIDRIGFATEAEAAAALARIEAGEIGFDALAAERGLDAAVIDQGVLRARDLAEPAREAVFGAAEPGIVGPVATPLGPSLFRINAILAPRVTPFEAAREELRRERALVEARARMLGTARPVEDLLAGGATLEEIAADTPFDLGTVEIDGASGEGLAADPAAIEAAFAARQGEETDLVELEGGALATLRVEAIEPPRLPGLGEIRATVAADWIEAETTRRLEALAMDLAAEIDAGTGIDALAERLGRPAQATGPLARGDLLPEAPAGLVAAAFAVGPGGGAVAAEAGRAAVAQVAEMLPFDPDGPEAAGLVAAVTGQLRAQAAEDAFALYVQALQARAGVRVDQALFERVVAQFP